HRVVEEAVHAVAVVAVVLRGVDAALRGDAVRAPRRVVVREHRGLVTELTERRGGRRARQPAPHDDDVVLPSVRRVDELHRELVLVPLLVDRPLGDPGVQGDVRHGYSLVTIASGMKTLPAVMRPAK